MKKYGLISVVALIVLTNVIVLAGVAYNRSGEPDATVQLTERELHWQYHSGITNKEDTGLYLILKWSMPGFQSNRWDYTPTKNWINIEKLKEMGFDTSFSLEDNKASRYYSHQLPRQAYVVLEFNGDAYQEWEAGAQKRNEEIKQELMEEKKEKKKKNLENDMRHVQQELITHSHLFAVDGGRNPELLRKQYSDKSKFIITPAVFDISRRYIPRKEDESKSTQTPYLSGWIRKISIPAIHVTSNYRSFFISDIKTHTKIYLPRDKPLSDLESRYQVTLSYGKRYEPWIAEVKKLK